MDSIINLMEWLALSPLSLNDNSKIKVSFSVDSSFAAPPYDMGEGANGGVPPRNIDLDIRTQLSYSRGSMIRCQTYP